MVERVKQEDSNPKVLRIAHLSSNLEEIGGRYKLFKRLYSDM